MALPRDVASPAAEGPAASAVPASLPSIAARTGMRVLVVSTSKDPNPKVTVLLFPHGSDQPALALKVPTTDSAEAAVERERRVLEELHRRIEDPAIAATIPRPEGWVPVDGRKAMLTTALPGVPMTTPYHRWRHTARQERVEADLRAAGSWLETFQHATGGSPGPLDPSGPVADRLADRFAGRPNLEVDLERFAAIRDRLRRELVPRAASHGDLWCGNILADDGRVTGVVDWELATAEGDPGRDLVRFVLTYALYLDRHTRRSGAIAGHQGLRADRWGVGIDHALDGAGWFPDLVRGFLKAGLARLGASPDRWWDAALAGVIDVAATADHDGFAARHLEIFHRLSERMGG